MEESYERFQMCGHLDHQRWLTPDYRVQKMVQIMKDEIETSGFCQLLRTIKKAWPGQPSSTVDHIWTNSPGNVMSTYNKVRASSDHNHIGTILRTKVRIELCQELRNRK